MKVVVLPSDILLTSFTVTQDLISNNLVFPAIILVIITNPIQRVLSLAQLSRSLFFYNVTVVLELNEVNTANDSAVANWITFI